MRRKTRGAASKTLLEAQILSSQGIEHNDEVVKQLLGVQDMKSRERAARAGVRKGKDLDRALKDSHLPTGGDPHSVITIPAGSPFEHVEAVIRGDKNISNLYTATPVKRDKLTLADHVYDMAANTKFMSLKVHPAALDKANLNHREFIGTGAVRYYNQLTRNIRRAEKIVLEDDFVRQVVQTCTFEGHVDLGQVKNALTLARNPFSRTWLEWDCRVMLNERAKLGSIREVAEDAPSRIGALCVSTTDDGSEYYVDEFIQQPLGEPVAPIMFTMGVNTEQPIQIPRLRRQKDGVRINVNSLENRSSILLGQFQIAKAMDWECVQQISLDLNELYYTITFDQIMNYATMEYDVKESAGSIRFLSTALALINSAKIQYNVMSIPSGRRLSGGKSIPYMEHRTVKILVPAGKKDVTKYLNSILKTESAKKRAHKVRGFWRTLDRGTGAERRVWVKDHVRGDASLGWVNQDHLVTT